MAGLGWFPCSRLKPVCGDSTEKSQAPDDGCIMSETC